MTNIIIINKKAIIWAMTLVVTLALLLVYQVNAADAPLESGESGAPSTPTGVSVRQISKSGYETSEELTWTAVAEADGYLVYEVVPDGSTKRVRVATSFWAKGQNAKGDECPSGACKVELTCNPIVFNISRSAAYCQWRVAAAKGNPQSISFIPTAESAASAAVSTRQTTTSPSPAPSPSPSPSPSPEPSPEPDLNPVPETAPAKVTRWFNLAESAAVELGDNTYNIEVISIGRDRKKTVSFNIGFEDAVTVKLKRRQAKALDLDGDGEKEVKVKYLSVKQNRVKLKLMEIAE